MGIFGNSREAIRDMQATMLKFQHLGEFSTSENLEGRLPHKPEFREDSTLPQHNTLMRSLVNIWAGEHMFGYFVLSSISHILFFLTAVLWLIYGTLIILNKTTWTSSKPKEVQDCRHSFHDPDLQQGFPDMKLMGTHHFRQESSLP